MRSGQVLGRWAAHEVQLIESLLFEGGFYLIQTELVLICAEGDFLGLDVGFDPVLVYKL